MLDVRTVLAHATRRLADRAEAELLLAHVLGKPRSWLIAHAEDVLAPEYVSAYGAMIERRQAGEPVAYITGRREFWSLELTVTPETLIPRPDTELLVELALERLPADKICRVLDLGTGSGAVALAIARERPRAQVVATDFFAGTLAVAQSNARRHRLAHICFLQGDWLAPLDTRPFDVIVSNPPYIESHDPHLQQGDLRFEPLGALAAGSDGLDAIGRIVRGAGGHLMPGGWLLFEHGWNQGTAARALLGRAGFVHVWTARDLAQRERVSAGRWPASAQA